MSITSDINDKDGLTTMPHIPPPNPRRSPLVSGTYKLNSENNKPRGAGPDGKAGAKTNPFTKSVKTTLALVTVSASIIGAFTTIASFAHSVAPLAAPQPVFSTSDNGAAVPVDPDHVSGPLSALSISGKALGQCPLSHTTMEAKLSGYVARVNVTQVFTNPYKEKIEAVYNFPLSDDGAVDDMTIKIGERTIKGKIKTRDEAKQIYDQAKNIGHAAAILDQQRTNIFTQHVANIEPGRSITVQISYVELLKFEDGRYTFTMPTTIGPRFFPSASPTNVAESASNALAALLRGNAPAGTIAAPNLSINVDVDAGLPIKNVNSKLFPILVDKENASHCLVSLQKSVNLPDRDFVLTYELDKPQSIKSGYLAYRDDQAQDKDGYATFMLLPPAKVTSATAAPREMIFLIDCSGSQAGRPIEKAKETLHYIVDHMNPNDTFQVLAFSDEVATLSEKPIRAGLAEKLQAHDFINRLNAQGGTWMAPAVERVLHHTEPVDRDLKRLRIVTFMTDGFVGNDLEIMSLIQKERGDSRWFAFGTGDSVNHTLIDNVSRLGGGESDYVLLNSSAEEAGKKFYSRISSPALTDVTLKCEGLELYDVYPSQVSDVWANKPLDFTARYKSAGHGKVVITGFANGRPYKQALDVSLPERDTTNSAIEKIWARQKIDSLTDGDLIGLCNRRIKPSIKSAITTVALDHKLMSDFTSFVAVDTAFTEGDGLRTVPVPNLQPEGVENQTVGQYGGPIQGTTNGTIYPQGADATVIQYGQPAMTNGIVAPQGTNALVGQYGQPGLQGATNGTIAPQGADATIVYGVNTSGTVRVNNLAQIEALLNIIANLAEVLGIAWGGATLIMGLTHMSRGTGGGLKQVLIGLVIVLCGLAAPGCINWLMAAARDANLFS